MLTGDEAAALLHEAVAAAKALGLGWMDTKLELKPAPELVQLIRKSQEVAAAKDSAEGE